GSRVRANSRILANSATKFLRIRLRNPRVIMDIDAYCTDLACRARQAARVLATVTGARKNQWLKISADALEARTPEIIEANARDIAGAAAYELSAAQIDRLRLTPQRIRAAADGLREVAALADPIGRVLDSSVRPNGL